MFKKLFIAACYLFVSYFMFAGTADAQIIVTPGYDPTLGADDMGIRFRSFQPTGADEVYLGVPSLGVAANRVAQQINWASYTTWNFTFIYDPLNDLLKSQVGTYSWLTYSPFMDDLVIDALKVSVGNRDTNGDIWLTGLTVNGALAGTGQFGAAGTKGWNDWMLTGIPFANGLTITGTINRTGVFSSSQENSKIEITAGGAVVIPEPGTFLLLGSGFLGLGLVGYFRRKRA